jgi:hypothetical protein
MHTIDNAYGHEQIMCHGKDLMRSFVRLIAATICHWLDTNDQKAYMGRLVKGTPGHLSSRSSTQASSGDDGKHLVSCKESLELSLSLALKIVVF